MFSCKKAISSAVRSCEFWYIGSDKFVFKDVLLGKYKGFYIKNAKSGGLLFFKL